MKQYNHYKGPNAVTIDGDEKPKEENSDDNDKKKEDSKDGKDAKETNATGEETDTKDEPSDKDK